MTCWCRCSRLINAFKLPSLFRAFYSCSFSFLHSFLIQKKAKERKNVLFFMYFTNSMFNVEKSEQFYGYYFNRNIMQINLIDIQLTACNLNSYLFFFFAFNWTEWSSDRAIEFSFQLQQQTLNRSQNVSVTIDCNKQKEKQQKLKSETNVMQMMLTRVETCN